jgi:tetratricopeptide (TPR) repeat protein
MGTPSYMAPEQAAGKINELGPATDVYALGAILYECLTGRPPFRGATVFDTVNQVLHQEPVAVRQLQPNVPKDLETICHKCLSKEAAKRYASAQALADDLRNYVESRPITARPVGRWERTWKWCRRYPTAAALILVSTLAAVVATSMAVWAVTAAEAERLAKLEAQEQKTKAERAAAAEKRAKVQIEKEVYRFAGLLSGINPRNEEKGGPPLYAQLRERASKAADELDAEAVGDPFVVANLQTILGNTLRELGDSAKAIEVLEKARVTQTQGLGVGHPDTLVTVHNLATAYGYAGNLPQAIALFEQIRDVSVQKLGEDHPQTLATLHNLAAAYRDGGKLSQAIALFEQVRDAKVKKWGPDHPDTLSTLHQLGIAYRAAGKLPQALALFEQVRDGYIRIRGADHLDTLVALHELAAAYQADGKLSQAIALFEQVRDAQVQKLGRDHPETLTTLHNLALTYGLAQKLPQAITLFEQVRDTKVQKLGPDHPSTLATLSELARAYRTVGKLSQAIALYEQVREAQLKTLGRDHPMTLTTLVNLATAYRVAGKLPQALPLFDQAATGIAKRQFLLDSAAHILPSTIRAYEAAQQWDQAERWQRQWLPVVKTRFGADSPAFTDELAGLGLNLLRQQKWDAAEATLRECLAIRAEKEADTWTTYITQSLLGAALQGQKKYTAAEPFLLQGYQGLKLREAQIPNNAKVLLTEALERLIALYEAQGKKEEVAKWQRELQTLKVPTNDARKK